jgi:replicative DNA helicase
MNSVNTLPGSLAKIQSTVQSPHNIEAEQQLLGAILLNNEVFDRISSIINSDHFLNLFIREFLKHQLHE